MSVPAALARWRTRDPPTIEPSHATKGFSRKRIRITNRGIRQITTPVVASSIVSPQTIHSKSGYTVYRALVTEEWWKIHLRVSAMTWTAQQIVHVEKELTTSTVWIYFPEYLDMTHEIYERNMHAVRVAVNDALSHLPDGYTYDGFNPMTDVCINYVSYGVHGDENHVHAYLFRLRNFNKVRPLRDGETPYRFTDSIGGDGNEHDDSGINLLAHGANEACPETQRASGGTNTALGVLKTDVDYVIRLLSSYVTKNVYLPFVLNSTSTGYELVFPRVSGSLADVETPISSELRNGMRKQIENGMRTLGMEDISENDIMWVYDDNDELHIMVARPYVKIGTRHTAHGLMEEIKHDGEGRSRLLLKWDRMRHADDFKERFWYHFRMGCMEMLHAMYGDDHEKMAQVYVRYMQLFVFACEELYDLREQWTASAIFEPINVLQQIAADLLPNQGEATATGGGKVDAHQKIEELDREVAQAVYDVDYYRRLLNATESVSARDVAMESSDGEGAEDGEGREGGIDTPLVRDDERDSLVRSYNQSVTRLGLAYKKRAEYFTATQRAEVWKGIWLNMTCTMLMVVSLLTYWSSTWTTNNVAANNYLKNGTFVASMRRSMGWMEYVSFYMANDRLKDTDLYANQLAGNLKSLVSDSGMPQLAQQWILGVGRIFTMTQGATNPSDFSTVFELISVRGAFVVFYLIIALAKRTMFPGRLARFEHASSGFWVAIKALLTVAPVASPAADLMTKGFAVCMAGLGLGITRMQGGDRLHKGVTVISSMFKWMGSAVYNNARKFSSGDELIRAQADNDQLVAYDRLANEIWELRDEYENGIAVRGDLFADSQGVRALPMIYATAKQIREEALDAIRETALYNPRSVTSASILAHIDNPSSEISNRAFEIQMGLMGDVDAKRYVMDKIQTEMGVLSTKLESVAKKLMEAERELDRLSRLKMEDIKEYEPPKELISDRALRKQIAAHKELNAQKEANKKFMANKMNAIKANEETRKVYQQALEATLSSLREQRDEIEKEESKKYKAYLGASHMRFSDYSSKIVLESLHQETTKYYTEKTFAQNEAKTHVNRLVTWLYLTGRLPTQLKTTDANVDIPEIGDPTYPAQSVTFTVPQFLY
jgi:hypothetical protein